MPCDRPTSRRSRADPGPSFTVTLRRLIEWGVVPVVNENDTTATDEITFGDNDFLAAQVAILLDARLLVLLSDVSRAASQRSAQRSRRRADRGGRGLRELAGMEIGDRTSAFGSGGMRSKVAAAEMAAESGIPATICNGTTEGTLLAAARGESSGTAFVAQQGKASSFKLWLKFAKPIRGRLNVDDGAARVLRESGSSSCQLASRRSMAASRSAMRSRSPPTTPSSARASSTIPPRSSRR